MVESIQQDQKGFIRALHGGFCDYYTHKKRRLSLLYIGRKITQTLGAQNDEIGAFSTILVMFCYVNQKVTNHITNPQKDGSRWFTTQVLGPSCIPVDSSTGAFHLFEKQRHLSRSTVLLGSKW